MRDDKLKQRIEAKYTEDELPVETEHYAGQMTIAFCAAADELTDLCADQPTLPGCSGTSLQ